MKSRLAADGAEPVADTPEQFGRFQDSHVVRDLSAFSVGMKKGDLRHQTRPLTGRYADPAVTGAG